MFKKILKYTMYILNLLLAYVAGLVLYILKKEYRGVWLIAERGRDARDNGYHLFKYIVQEHPEINAYYVIDKKSADYTKISSIGKSVNYKSAKHYILFAISKIKISTHIMGYSPDINCYRKIDEFGFIYGKKVFLQHGIILNDVNFLYYPNVKVDLFVCGAYPEYQYVNKKFGHREGVVQVLGLCRYDELNSSSNIFKQILLMPTWRGYIFDCENNEDFIKTEYYIFFQSLINNETLHQQLVNYGYNLVFYPHFEVQKFINTFSTRSGNIIIASFDDYDVQKLLKDSSILITDFSSVFFDFGYLKKPVLFYQFDEIEFRNQHYSKGYFSYADHGFGPIVTTEKQLIGKLELILKNGAVLETTYLDRIDSFFTITDNNNCKRNFDAINKL